MLFSQWDKLGQSLRRGAGSWAPMALLLAVQQAPVEEPEIPSYGSLLLQTVLALILVCVLAYVLLRYGLKWLMRGRKTSLGALDLLDRLPLDNRRTLYVVKAAGRVYLLGATDASLELIAEIDPKDLPQTDQSTDGASGSAPKRSFFEVLTGKKGPARRPPRNRRTRPSGQRAGRPPQSPSDGADSSERSERDEEGAPD